MTTSQKGVVPGGRLGLELTDRLAPRLGGGGAVEPFAGGLDLRRHVLDRLQAEQLEVGAGQLVGERPGVEPVCQQIAIGVRQLRQHRRPPRGGW